jgi:glutamine synthetase
MSYERLKPHSWAAYYANLATRDREALLRICPYPQVAGVDVGKRYNVEYRGADACASPYLQLAMLVFAGLSGIRDRLPAPFISTGDPGRWTKEERAAKGIGELPHALEEALEALETDAMAMGWLGPVLAKAYLVHKRGELSMKAGIDTDELCRLYAQAY